jgi:hypothetical protein
MSTRAIKNIISSKLDSLITRSKQKIKEEGKNKITDLKKQLPTPNEIREKLKIDINQDSCSAEGQEKFDKKIAILSNRLNFINNNVKSSLDEINKVDEKITEIINADTDGPIGQIQKTVKPLEILVKTLQYFLILAPLIYLANSGPTASGAIQAQTAKKEEKANSKVGEYIALFASIPLIIAYFRNEANKIKKPINIIKPKLQFIQNEVIKLQTYMAALALQQQVDCLNLNNGGNDSEGEATPTYSDLELYLQQLQDQYNVVLQELQVKGKTKAIERTYTLKQVLDNFEEDYNTSFKTINPTNIQ